MASNAVASCALHGADQNAASRFAVVLRVPRSASCTYERKPPFTGFTFAWFGLWKTHSRVLFAAGEVVNGDAAREGSE